MKSHPSLKKIIALSLFGSLLAGCGSSGPNLEEGLWKVSFATSMAGMKIPAVSVEQCLTQKDLVPKQQSANDDCAVSDVNVNGDTVSWHMTCSNSSGQGEISYMGESMKGKMTVTTSAGGMSMTIESEISGQRIGDCKQ